MQLRVDREHLLPDSLTNRVLDRVIIASPLLDPLVLPLLEPLPVAQRHHCAHALAREAIRRIEGGVLGGWKRDEEEWYLRLHCVFCAEA